MTKFRTLKLSNALRKYSLLRPVLRCKTRWSGAFNMVERYFQLKDIIKQMVDDDVLDEEFNLRKKVIQDLNILFEDMVKFNSVMIALQSSTMDLLDARRLFDRCILFFPTMAKFLAPDSPIVHSPLFESTLVSMLKKVRFFF